MGGRLNWVVALMPEAEIVIEAFSLKRVESKSVLFPVYESTDGETRLILTGIGKTQAAAGTAVLAALSETSSGGEGWINFGIAGCRESRYGEPLLASRVTDEATDQSWFPVPVWPKKQDLSRIPLTTVESPLSDYSSVSGLVEMEASGFYPIALKQATVELAHVVKVVSDDPEHPLEELSKASVAGLCREAWPRIEKWASAFREVAALDQDRIVAPAGYDEWVDLVHLSVTQRHQLKRLLQEWYALGGDLLPVPRSGDQGKKVLQRLRNQLSERRKKEIRV
ncbi:MAG: hypothetical protein AAF357_13840 [Verrucomicrobiota bacterium]